MALSLFKRIKDSEIINKSKSVELVAYGGYTFSTLGTLEMNCHIQSTIHRLEFQIMDKPVA